MSNVNKLFMPFQKYGYLNVQNIFWYNSYDFFHTKLVKFFFDS